MNIETNPLNIDCQKEDRPFGVRIREARQALGLTQRAVGDMVGVTQQSVLAWEKGAKPTPEHRAALVRVLSLEGEATGKITIVPAPQPTWTWVDRVWDALAGAGLTAAAIALALTVK